MAAGGRTPKRKFELSCASVKASPPRRRRGSCKCLFGVPDREETRRLVSEQYVRDRKRFIRRFNFDIDSESEYKSGSVKSEESPALTDVGNLEIGMLGSPKRSPRVSLSPRTPRTPRTPRSGKIPRTPKTPASRRQLHMTDYWSSRKRTESSSSDKEN